MNSQSVYFTKYKKYKDLYFLNGGNNPQLYHKYKKYKYLHKKTGGAEVDPGSKVTQYLEELETDFKSATQTFQNRIQKLNTEIAEKINKTDLENNVQLKSVDYKPIFDELLRSNLQEKLKITKPAQTIWFFIARLTRNKILQKQLDKMNKDDTHKDKSNEEIEADNSHKEKIKAYITTQLNPTSKTKKQTAFIKSIEEFEANSKGWNVRENPLQKLDANGSIVPEIKDLPITQGDTKENLPTKVTEADNLYLATSVAITYETANEITYSCEKKTRKTGGPDKWSTLNIIIQKEQKEFYPTIHGNDLDGKNVIDGFWDIPDREGKRPNRVTLHLPETIPASICEIAFADKLTKNNFLMTIISLGSQPLFYSRLGYFYDSTGDEKEFKRIVEKSKVNLENGLYENAIHQIKDFIIQQAIKQIKSKIVSSESTLKKELEDLTKPLIKTYQDQITSITTSVEGETRQKFNRFIQNLKNECDFLKKTTSRRMIKGKFQDVPNEYLCPISREIMTDPVVTADGQSYEKAAIERWLAGHNTSPATGASLPNKELIPNITLKKLIKDYQDKLETST